MLAPQSQNRKTHTQMEKRSFKFGVALVGIICYTAWVKTAISIADTKARRHAQVAAKHNLNRSEFYTRAGDWYADELEGKQELTRLADEVIAEAGQPAAEWDDYLAEVTLVMSEIREL